MDWRMWYANVDLFSCTIITMMYCLSLPQISYLIIFLKIVCKTFFMTPLSAYLPAFHTFPTLHTTNLQYTPYLAIFLKFIINLPNNMTFHQWDFFQPTTPLALKPHSCLRIPFLQPWKFSKVFHPLNPLAP